MEEKLTEALVTYYRRHEGKWPGHVVLSHHGLSSLRAECEDGFRFVANMPDGPMRYMGVPIKTDSDLADEEILVKDEPA